MTDRGANFVKAFAVYNPINCFGHRLNNILKICFFQCTKKKKNQNNASSINDNPPAMVENYFVPVIPGENASSDSESELSELELENQELNAINDDTLVKFQKKKQRATATTAQKLSVVDIPAEAKKIILLLKQTKDLVKYVKQVSL
jgi:hypothetical protein